MAEETENIVETLRQQGAKQHTLEIQRNKNNRWVKVGEIDCNLDEAEFDLIEEIKIAKWGGYGEFLVITKDAEGKVIRNIKPYKITIEKEETEKEEEETEEREDKSKTPPIDLQKAIAEDIETERLLKVHESYSSPRQRVKELMDRQERLEEMVVAIHDKLDGLGNNEKANEKSNEKNNERSLIEVLISQQNQQLNTILTKLTERNNDSPMTEVFKTLLVNQQQKKDPITALLDHPLGTKLVDSIFKKDTPHPLESMIPTFFEKIVQSFNEYNLKVGEAMIKKSMEPPPTNPDDQISRTLRLMQGIRDLSLDTIKQMMEAYFRFKQTPPQWTQGALMPAQPIPNPPTPQPPQPAQPTTNQTMPAQPISNHQPPRQPAQPTADQMIQKRLDESIDFIKANLSAPVPQLCEAFEKNFPDIVYIINQTPEIFLSDHARAILKDEIYNKIKEMFEFKKGK